MSSVSEHRSAGCGRANIISNSFRVVQRTSVVGACERDEDDMSFHEVCACYVLVLQFNDLLIDCISCRCTERRIWTRPSRRSRHALHWSLSDPVMVWSVLHELYNLSHLDLLLCITRHSKAVASGERVPAARRAEPERLAACT